MNRFLQLSFVAVALSGFASATMISMNSPATFTGGLDLAIGGADNNTTTRMSATLNAASSTSDLLLVGDESWLALGTLRISEGIDPQDATPNILASEYDNGYQLGVAIDTNLGLFNFLASNALFSTVNFAPGGFDADTTDAAAEIAVDFSSLNQTLTVGLVTYSLGIVDNEFSSNSILQFNQNATAATVWLRAAIIRIDEEPNPAETAEVGTMAMLGSGLLGLGYLARRRSAGQQLKFA